MPDRNSQWYQHLLTLFSNFSESNTEGTNFRIMFMFYVSKMCMFCIVLNLCNIWSSEKPWGVTLCGWRGYKPSINNNNLLCHLIVAVEGEVLIVVV